MIAFFKVRLSGFDDFNQSASFIEIVKFILTPWARASRKIYNHLLGAILDNINGFKWVIHKITYHRDSKLKDIITVPGIVELLDSEIIEIILLLSQGPLAWFKPDARGLARNKLSSLKKASEGNALDLMKRENLIKSLNHIGLMKLPFTTVTKKGKTLIKKEH